MTENRSSSGDPVATLRLLWRADLPAGAAAPRGPRRRLDVDTIVAAAIALADAEGLSSLTMRRLSDRLGAGPMTVYTYVPGRAELLDLMLDDVYGRMPRPVDRDRSWLDRVREIAGENRRLFARHPWAADVSTLRPPLGPGQMAKYEFELAAFTGSGLDDVQTDDALTHLLTFVRANARDAIDAARSRQTGGDDQQWWQTAGPLLDTVLDPVAYPLAVRIGAAAGAAHGSAHDPQHAYDFGLARIVVALEQLAGLSRPG